MTEFRILGIDNLPLPLRFIETMWSHAHVGYKTEVFITGKIGKAINASLFRNGEVTKSGAYIRIELKKS